MQCENQQQIARCCFDVARRFQVDSGQVPPWTSVALLLGTSAVECGFMRGVDGRAGLGLWKTPLPQTVKMFSDLRYRRYNRYVSKSQRLPWELFISSWLGISSPGYFNPSRRELRYLLVNDDTFSCTVAYWLYLGNIPKLKDNLNDIADFWYECYPSDHGEMRPASFLDAWAARECESLMHGLGYQ